MSDETIYLQPPKYLNYSRDIIHCHKYLQERWVKVVALFAQETGNDLTITCTWRSIQEQLRLYQKGRSEPGKLVTNFDGVHKKSNHNVYPSRALDVAVNTSAGPVKCSMVWDEEYYKPLPEICRKLGLISGGVWLTFQHWPHVEIPEDIV